MPVKQVAAGRYDQRGDINFILLVVTNAGHLHYQQKHNMKVLFIVLLIFSSLYLSAQTVSNMKVEKPKSDTIKELVETIQQAERFTFISHFGPESPSYPGGDSAWAEFVTKNLNRQIARDRNVYGAVYISFVVDITGDIGAIKILRSVDSALDAEAIRIVSLSGKWISGKMNGQIAPLEHKAQILFKRF